MARRSRCSHQAHQPFRNQIIFPTHSSRVKKTAIIVFCLLCTPLWAQYAGGIGDGDTTGRLRGRTLNGVASTASWFFGGGGDGDVKGSVTTKLLDGTTAVLAWFFGGSGDGDSRGTQRSYNLNGVLSEAAWFYGGNGDGEVKSPRLTNSYLGDIEWVGTNTTDWNTSSNWRQNALPSNGRIMISASATRDLVLDRNRTITYIDFNGSGRKVNLGNYNLTLNGEYRGVNSSNYFRTNGTGKLKRAVAQGQQVDFPVGNQAYIPVSITNATGTLDTFSVGAINEVLYRGNTGFVVRNIPRVKATWYIDKLNPTANAGSGVNFNFSWPNGQDTGVANMILYHWDGNAWQKYPGGLRAGTTFAHNGYKGTFSPFALGDELSVLPVTWLYMNCARKSSNTVVLNWATAEENDASHFEIQRMNDTGFVSIGRVNAVGNSQTPTTYRFVDASAPAKATLYRIKQVDLNREFSFSPACMTTGSALTDETAPLQVSPVPADDKLNIQSPSLTEGFDFFLYNAAGSVVHKGKSAGSFVAIKTGTLPQGIYTLEVRANGVLQHSRLMITRN